jgi:hypothetical protein
MSWFALAAIVAASALVTAGATGCDSCKGSATPGPQPRGSGSASAAPPERPPARRALSFIDALSRCDVDHRGPAIDLGTDMLVGRLGWAATIPPSLRPVEHDGATWTQLLQRSVELDVMLLESAPIFVELRVRSKAAKSVWITIDDAPLGSLRLNPGEIKVVKTGATTLPLDAGPHRISLRFSPKSADDPYADIDWIRLGVPDEIEATFGAPTLVDIVDSGAALGQVPHRSLVLRPPAYVRCALRVPDEGRLRASVGLLGEGRAEAEVRVLVDGAEPVSLLRREISGGAAASWTEIDASLDAFAGKLVTLELGAPAGATTGRLAFGEPEVVAPTSLEARSPAARGALVVVLTGVEATDLPPWSGATGAKLEAFEELGRRGATFLRHRAPSTLDVANVASLLSALPPETHGLVDSASRLPASVVTVLETARASEVRTGFFTAVPTTFAPFALQQGASEIVEQSPATGEEAVATLSRATAWLVRTLGASTSARALAVVHLRGGHPPWTPSPKQLDSLAPTDYAGDLQPRRAAQQMSDLRRRKNLKIPDADRIRMRALHALGIAQHDAALAETLKELEGAQLLDEMLLVVTADSASSVEQLFAPDLPLAERSLALPMWAVFPGGKLAGTSVRAPTEMVDVGRTLFDSLGLTLPDGSRGPDLFEIATNQTTSGDRPQLATTGNRYASRWGDLVLLGQTGTAPLLCDLDLDPTCAFDRRPVLPLAAQASFRAMLVERRRRADAPARESADLDDATRAALTVWGR